MPEGYFNPCFEILAGLMSIQYCRLTTRSSSSENHDQFVDKNNLERTVRAQLNICLKSLVDVIGVIGQSAIFNWL